MEAEEKKRMNLFEALKENPGHVSAFFDVSAECIAVVTDENYRIVSFNTNFARLPGLSENPVGRRLEDLLCLLEEGEFSLLVSGEAGNVFPQMLRVCHTGILYKCYTFAIQGGVLLLGERLGATDNETLQTMSLLNNELSVLSRELGKKNRELEKAYSRITELSRTDALTGLSNRRYFNERYEEEFALSQRHGFALSVAMMDLDFFKRVNDNLGHNRGDEVLVAFADILRRNCRLEDFPSRFGGEEFIVFMPRTASGQAFAFGERLRSMLSDTDILEEPQWRITVSIGISQMKTGDSPEGLIWRADEALYEAKAQGRNRCAVK